MEIKEKTLQDVKISDIFIDHDFNCRGNITIFSCKGLADDIKKNGLLNPPLLEPYDLDDFKFKAVAGHRRILACTINAMGDPDATMKAFVVTGLTREEAYVLNFAENIAREDLNIIQEAKAVLRFESLGWDRDRIAKELKVSTGWVAIREKVLSLPEDVQEQCAAGLISQAQIMEIGKAITPTAQREMARRAITHKLHEGKAIKLKKKKKDDPAKRQIREVVEVHMMQDVIREILGNNLATRVLGWASGAVTTSEVFSDIAEMASDEGKYFNRMLSLMEAHAECGE